MPSANPPPSEHRANLRGWHHQAPGGAAVTASGAPPTSASPQTMAPRIHKPHAGRVMPRIQGLVICKWATYSSMREAPWELPSPRPRSPLFSPPLPSLPYSPCGHVVSFAFNGHFHSALHRGPPRVPRPTPSAFPAHYPPSFSPLINGGRRFSLFLLSFFHFFLSFTTYPF